MRRPLEDLPASSDDVGQSEIFTGASQYGMNGQLLKAVQSLYEKSM